MGVPGFDQEVPTIFASVVDKDIASHRITLNLLGLGPDITIQIWSVFSIISQFMAFRAFRAFRAFIRMFRVFRATDRSNAFA